MVQAKSVDRRGQEGKAVSDDRGLGSSSRMQAIPARSAAVSTARCAAILGTLKEITTATADVEGCRWMLECIANELQAEQGVLILCNPLSQELEFVVYNQDPSVPRRYADYYGDLDPTGLPDYVKGKVPLPEGTGSPPVRSPLPAVFDLMEVVDYRSLVATEFYNDFFKTGGIYYDLVAFVSAVSSARGAVCLHRAHRRKPFSAEEVAILDMIAPFVGNHLEKMVSASVLALLQMKEGKGVIVCDARGRVLFCNDFARNLCSPLRRLRDPTPALDEVSFVGRSLGDLDMLAATCNLEVRSREIVLEQGGPGRIITLEPRGTSSLAWAEPLKERFGLSDREIEVLGQVMAGGGNREIAQALFIAECTVKKHMQSIAAKVGARTRTSIAHAVRQELGLTP
ncbi:MAG: helix-turn-helix transcriptional regulator [Actinomycetia bacterium]|nr:helix-turn-helix transcriptional regulator [Actinomycetes bacterium]